MEFLDRLIYNLKLLKIEQLQWPYKNYSGSEGKIYGCKYNYQNNWKQGILKVIQYDQSLNSKDEQSIYKEIIIYNKLVEDFKNNENLVTIVNIIHFQDLKSFCILMEECDINLKDFKSKLTSLNSKLQFFQQFLKGYKSLYDKRVIHRDIKPENILISFKMGKPIYQLADFGVAKLCEQFFNNQSQMGTKIYAAPELQYMQSQNNFQFDYEKISKVDVYSIGLVLYELQFQKLPFDKPKNLKEFYNSPLSSRLQKLGKIEYSDQWFVNLIMYMIQSNPDERVSFQELYKCYDDKLTIFIERCKKLAENFLISYVRKGGDNTQRYNTSLSPNRQNNIIQNFNEFPLQKQQIQNQQFYINKPMPHNPISPINIQQDVHLSPFKYQGIKLDFNQQKQHQIQQYQYCQTDRGNDQQFKNKYFKN
ncbi:unnamed protein product [Paramecium primaurelia]|uniref:Protein kinase domain-containing protein n=1 Tax=Paramecium primaurelia TaxID=5886 RepID=A0A8S1NFR2_PARPR|nr:unnamed protein product [Paramecium primaurelia]